MKLFIMMRRCLALGFRMDCQLDAVVSLRTVLVNFLGSLPLIINLYLKVVSTRVGEWVHSHVRENGSTCVL